MKEQIGAENTAPQARHIVYLGMPRLAKHFAFNNQYFLM